MVGSKQGWVKGGRRRVGQDWEAKCRRPNNGQAASTDLPTPPAPVSEASTCFPSVSANIGPSICPVCARLAMRCPLRRVIHTHSVRQLSPSIFFLSFPPPPPPLRPFSPALLVVRLTLGKGGKGTGRENERILWILFFFFSLFSFISFPLSGR